MAGVGGQNAGAPLILLRRGGFAPIVTLKIHSPFTAGGWPSRAALLCLGKVSVPNYDQTDLSLEQRFATVIERALASMEYELVRVSILGRQRPTVQVMIDRLDGKPVAIEDCEAVSHQLSATFDVEDPLPGAWTLEVSSSGIDRPLVRAKDWNRFSGHLAKAEVSVPVDGRKRFSGVVLGADEEHARMRLDDGTDISLPLRDIRRAKLVLTDELIRATAADASPH